MLFISYRENAGINCFCVMAVSGRGMWAWDADVWTASVDMASGEAVLCVCEGSLRWSSSATMFEIFEHGSQTQGEKHENNERIGLGSVHGCGHTWSMRRRCAAMSM